MPVIQAAVVMVVEVVVVGVRRQVLHLIGTGDTNGLTNGENGDAGTATITRTTRKYSGGCRW